MEPDRATPPGRSIRVLAGGRPRRAGRRGGRVRACGSCTNSSPHWPGRRCWPSRFGRSTLRCSACCRRGTRWAIGPLLATTVVGDRVSSRRSCCSGSRWRAKAISSSSSSATSAHHGVAVPDWIEQLPVVGATIAEWWRANLSDPVPAEELIGRVNLRDPDDIGAGIWRRDRPPARDAAVHAC